MSRLLITQLSIEGMRSLDHVELELSARADDTRGNDDARAGAAPTVLIGPNGAGKSTIVEACELLRKAGSERPFVGRLFDAHGGPPALLRKNGKRLRLGVRLMAGNGTELTYNVSLRSIGTSLTVERERWLEDYRGLGELRAAGYENVVFRHSRTRDRRPAALSTSRADPVRG